MEIKLPCGAICLIDKKDSWIRKVFTSWYKVRGHVCCERYIKTKYGRAREKYYLHRLIIGSVVKGFEVDHINRNGLDNRRCNLRLATRGENTMNKVKSKKATSKYRGVCYRQSINKKNPWTAYIEKKGKRYELGYFKTENEAARAYNKKSKQLWGEFAFLNDV